MTLKELGEKLHQKGMGSIIGVDKSFSVWYSEPIHSEISQCADTLFITFQGGVNKRKLREFIEQLEALDEYLNDVNVEDF